jgi:hypothetical protein
MGPYQDLRQLVFVATVGPFKIIGSLPQQLEWPIQDDGQHISDLSGHNGPMQDHR